MIDVQIREITGTEFVPIAFRLRYEVWREEVSLRPEFAAAQLISDEHDLHARHWAAFHENTVIASGRMCIHQSLEESPDANILTEMQLPNPVATINRLIVDRNWRRRGISKQIDDCRINAARESGAKCVVVCSSGPRIHSLEKYGFTLTSFHGPSSFAPALVSSALVLVL